MDEKQEQVAEETTEEPASKSLSEVMEEKAAQWGALSDATTLIADRVAALVRQWSGNVYVLEGHIIGLQEENEAMIAANPEWESLADEPDEEQPRNLSEKMERYARDGEAEATVAPSTTQASISASVSVTRKWIPEVQALQEYALGLMQDNKRLTAEAESGRASSLHNVKLRKEVERLEKALSLEFDKVVCAHRDAKAMQAETDTLRWVIKEGVREAFRSN